MKNNLRSSIVTTFVIILLFTMHLSAFAEDENTTIPIFPVKQIDPTRKRTPAKAAFYAIYSEGYLTFYLEEIPDNIHILVSTNNSTTAEIFDCSSSTIPLYIGNEPGVYDIEIYSSENEYYGVLTIE